MSTDRISLSHLRHELHTPLNHIIGYSELLLESAAEQDMTALEPGLRELHQHARQLLLLVDDVLGRTRKDGDIDLGRLSSLTSAPISSLIAAADELKVRAQQAGPAGVDQDLEHIAGAARTLRSMIAGGASWRLPEATPSGADTARLPVAPLPAAETGSILVVDDNAENREMLSRRLARAGHRVQAVASGGEALALMRRQPIDLVLLDVLMPEMSGCEVLQRLTADPALCEIPVLMISALDEMESVVRCIELGAADYLPKPFDPVLLRARIGACLEKKRLRDREALHLQQLGEWNQRLEQRVGEQVALLERLGRLKRFFSPQLAELIVAGGAEDPLATHRRDLTVCFLDLRGFTAFAESVEPEEVMGVLREYHAEMGRLIVEHEGTLERFTGDGMMIFFNDPVPVPNPAERTVRMALAMRARVGELIVSWLRKGYELELGIGIAQGYATIGAIGYEGRWDYGAIGTVTNLAARLCGEARPGQILVSKRLVAATADLFEVESVGELNLKGLHRPVTAYNVIRAKASQVSA
ncbi:MAG TPA: response regulator [Steroidobacteraceae bacterium]|nr:response regulator [Steroidobacteraceae bacterium]